MTKIGLGALLDTACTEILRRSPADRGSKLVVNPEIFRAVAQARPREVERGLPLMVLGLELDKSAEVPMAMFRIVQ
jgi:hypothetical protein